MSSEIDVTEDDVKNRSFLQQLFLLAGLLFLLSGCATPSAPRILWPAPPQTPKLEWIGVYYAESQLETSAGARALEALLGESGKKLLFPWGIAADGKGRVYVSDPGQANVLIFDFNARKVGLLFERMDGKPYGVTVDNSGKIYVVVPENKNIVVMAADHRPLFSFGEQVLEKPLKVVVDDVRQRIYVSDIAAHTIEVFDLRGQHLQTLGGEGLALGKLRAPSGVAVDKSGNLFVTEILNARVQVFSPEGEALYFFGQRSDQRSGFEMPKDLAFDSEGNLHIVDSRKSALLSYTPKGDFLLYTGMDGPTGKAIGFASPNSIFIDKQDRIYIADMLNKRFAEWQYLNADYLRSHPVTEQDLQYYQQKD